MIDISKLKYSLMLITALGGKLDITDAVQTLSWEENDSELALRTEASFYNIIYNSKRLSDLAKPNCVLVVTADWGSGSQEVARGRIQDWDPQRNGSAATTFDVTAYDELYYLQKSQDNRYYAAGKGTKAAITGIFKDWGIPLGTYNGPNVTHAKKTFKSEYLSDIVLKFLDDAVKKGAPKCVVRAEKGKVNVIPKGSNKTIYHFDAGSNVTVSKYEISIADLVTRVKVVGKENKAGRQAVEAVVNGLTKYGIRQKIVDRSDDETLAAAKSAAKTILNEEGQPVKTIELDGPDVPVIRKGDKIHVLAGALNGYYIVKSVQHNATERSMVIGIE